ncbi:MAG TPA: L-lactate permease [Clostridiaceae bacterium]|nr:L-lactate permease [Clostridiaceae bacterium]
MWQPDMPFENIFLTTIVALIPIIWIFFGMLKLHMPSQYAGITSLVFCAAIAALVWKMPAKHIIESVIEGIAVALWPIIWVIFTAIFTYNLSIASGSMNIISRMLSSISEDIRVQALIIAFAFGGFLEAAAGFGTAVAIPASILIALGFQPMKATIISLAALVIWAKLFPVKKPLTFNKEIKTFQSNNNPVSFNEGIKAWSPYIFILVLVLATRLVPALGFLSKYPFEITLRFYSGAGGKPVSFPLLTSPGSIIIISAVLGGLLQGVPIKEMLSVAMKTLRQTSNTVLTVTSIVSLAKLMGYSGMSSVVASSLSILTGRFFPLISPAMGALGTFITGSDTSSNVLFGELQKQTAIRINANAGWITAANATGATAGKMISPQSIAIATSSTGLKGYDGKILRETIKYALIFVVLLGIIVFGFQYF